MHDHMIALREDQPMLIAQCVRQTSHQCEKTLPARRDMSAVLELVLGPETCGRVIVAFVEQGVEGFQHKGPILIGCGFHGYIFQSLEPPSILRVSPVMPARRRYSSKST
jgi:hypothetical protein